MMEWNRKLASGCLPIKISRHFLEDPISHQMVSLFCYQLGSGRHRMKRAACNTVLFFIEKISLIDLLW